MAVVKLANQVLPGDLVDGAYFNANGDLLEATDGDVAIYVYRVVSGSGSMESIDRSSIPLSSRVFVISRASPTDESVPTVSEVQSAGYSLTAFGAYDEVVVRLGNSRELQFVYKLDLTGFKTPVSTRLDGYAIDAQTGDGTVAGVLPDHTLFRVGDTVLVTNCTDSAETNHYEKVADIGNGEAGWRGVLPPASVTIVQGSTGGGDLSIVDINTLAELNAIVSDATLGDAGDFATAAQGATADTAVQPGDNVSVLVNDAGYLAGVPAGLTWSAAAFSGNLTATDDTLQEVFDKLDALSTGGGGDLSLVDIDTLAELNAIITDATLGDAGDFATAAQGATADTAVQPGDNISGLTNDAGYLTSVPAGLTWSAAAFSGNLAVTDDTLQEVFNKLDALSFGTGDLSAADIDTLAELNAIITDATLGDAGDFATAAQGATADTAVQPGANISVFANDAGYLTSALQPGDNITALVNNAGYLTTAVQSGDNVSVLVNDAGYLTAVPAALTWSDAAFAGNLAVGDDTLQEVFNKLDALVILTSPISITSNLNWAGDGRTTTGGASVTIDPSARGYDRIVMDQNLTIVAGTFLVNRPFTVQLENPTGGAFSLTKTGFTVYGDDITDVAAGALVTIQGRCVVVNGLNKFAIFPTVLAGTM